MKQISILDSNYSTTKLCYKFLSDNYLDENGRIKENLKFSVTIPELNIINSKIPKKENEKIDTYIFLPKGENRKGEGGLRTKGYLKFSYKYENGKWWAIDFRGNKLFEVNLSEKILKDLEKERIEELPLVTVVTVVLNNKDGLEKTIKSVINQTYPNVEYIVIDGGSTDGTLDVIRRYENYIDYWISESDEGIYDAWNKGLKLFLSNWISFLGAGDIYDNEAVFNYVLTILEHKEKRDPLYISSKIKLGKNIIGEAWDWKVFRKYMNVAHIGSFHSRKLFNKYGIFNKYFKIAGDYELLLRPKDRLNALFLNKITVKADVNGVSVRNPLVFRETLIAKLLHTDRNIISLIYEYFVALLKGIIKRYLILK